MSGEPNHLVKRLRGRAAFCRDRHEVKTPELLEQAADALTAAEAQRDEARRVAEHFHARIAELTAARDALRGAEMPDVKRSAEFLQGAHWGVRRCIAWMHDRAGEMADPRARDILNATATNLGMWKGWHLRKRAALTPAAKGGEG